MGNTAEITDGVTIFSEAWALAQRIIPIGAVFAWDKTLTGTPALPDGIVECNGQTISDSDSLYDGVTIRNLNSENRFIQGDTTSGTTGGATSKTTSSKAATNHQLDNYGILFDPVGTHNHTIADIRPKFITMVWVMRIK